MITSLQISANDSFDELGSEEEQEEQPCIEIQPNSGLERLVNGFEKVVRKTFSSGASEDYLKILEIIPKGCTAKDIEQFSSFIGNYQSEKMFSYEAGMYLSAVINTSSTNRLKIHTSHLENLPDNLGYLNEKRIIVIKGNVGDSLGISMKSGKIIVHGDCMVHCGKTMQGGIIQIKGNVGEACGSEMSNGKIVVNGNADRYVGYSMRGGTIEIKGNAGDFLGTELERGSIRVCEKTDGFGDYIKGGKIYTHGKLDFAYSYLPCGKASWYHDNKLLIDEGRRVG